MITARMMQQLWALIESTQTSTLLHFDDSALVQLLLNRFASQQSIDSKMSSNLNTYIYSRLPLIRDIAAEKQASRQGSH
jgi:hypothetical protein